MPADAGPAKAAADVFRENGREEKKQQCIDRNAEEQARTGNRGIGEERRQDGVQVAGPGNADTRGGIQLEVERRRRRGGGGDERRERKVALQRNVAGR